jgi:hypothetical protein
MFDAEVLQTAAGSSDAAPPYDINRHAEFMISSFSRRNPGYAMRTSSLTLRIDRNDIVNSTVGF